MYVSVRDSERVCISVCLIEIANQLIGHAHRPIKRVGLATAKATKLNWCLVSSKGVLGASTTDLIF
jgi:hypothetical protein